MRPNTASSCRLSHRVLVSILACLALPAIVHPARAGMLVESSTEHFGVFRGVEFVRHTGRFVGVTPKGEFRVPFEFIAPVRSGRHFDTVVFEPPHFLLGNPGRETVLGAELLFARGFSYASVGFSNNGFNLLDAAAIDTMIAGESVRAFVEPIVRDVGILKQFAEALTNDPHAIELLGRVRHRYAYGVSQSAEALYELFFGPGAEGVFDLTVLQVPVWRPDFSPPEVLSVLPVTFVPPQNIGKVMLVSAEGDLLFSQSMQLRNAVTGDDASDDFRLYEVAGAPHLPQETVVQGVTLNPLDVSPVARAAFIAGHRWSRWGLRPPRSLLLAAAEPGAIDPIYFQPTGIARDASGNALGGVGMPDVVNGRALHIASALDVEVFPGLAGLVGFWFDLACVPAPGDTSGAPRFASRGAYLRTVVRQVFRLYFGGYLLARDAIDLLRDAVASDVGKPGSCP